MDGTARSSKCVGALFIAQAIGFDLSLSAQTVAVMTALLASIGGGVGCRRPGLVVIFIVLDAIGLGGHPGAEAIVLAMLAIDRPLDMYRTAVNVFSDSCGAAVIAHSEGEGGNRHRSAVAARAEGRTAAPGVDGLPRRPDTDGAGRRTALDNPKATGDFVHRLGVLARHVIQKKVEAAYARSDLFERRQRPMNDPSAHLDGHADGPNQQ